MLRSHVDLKSVFAGVAGARNDGRSTVDRSFRKAVVLHRSQLDVGHRLEDFLRLRALESKLGGGGFDDADFDILPFGEVRDPLEVLVAVRGVYDNEVVIWSISVDGDVVDKPAY